MKQSKVLLLINITHTLGSFLCVKVTKLQACDCESELKEQGKADSEQ